MFVKSQEIINEATKRTIPYPGQKDVTDCYQAVIDILDRAGMSDEDQITLLASMNTIMRRIARDASKATTYSDSHWG
ncbi:MAG: hypothetical protein LUE86_00530 [Clostridiales bacterium]|nr:hypothetical protein [Clostridiales bacterium]